jgi:hypothetical protein
MERDAIREVVLITSNRAYELVSQHALRWREGRIHDEALMVGLACPTCGEGVVLRVAGDLRGAAAKRLLAEGPACRHRREGQPVVHA